MPEPAQAARVVAELVARGETLGLAESITGGLLAAEVTAVPGASAVLVGSAVTYAARAKTAVLDVSADLLHRRGAVDPDVAVAMATGAQRLWGSDWAVATTGSAGPDPAPGGVDTESVAPGTGYVAVAGPTGVMAWQVAAVGGREAIREAVARAAWGRLLEILDAD